MLHHPVRFAARALTVVWAGFWTFFILASALGDGGSTASKLLVCTIGLTFFLSNASLVWMFEHAAGVVLGTEGVILTVLNYTYLHNTANTQLFLLLTLCVPPLAAGLALVTLKPNTHMPNR